MKRFLTLMAAICMLCLVSVSAFAYDAVDGSDWISKIEADTENGKVTITFNEDFISTYAPNGYRGALFNAEPTLDTANDEGFWVVYQGGEGTDKLNNGTYIGGFYGSGTAYEFDASALTEGETYYLAVTGNNANLSPDWTWTQDTVSFVYTTSEQNETADLSVIAYAAAALTGCGALVVAKKRHN